MNLEPIIQDEVGHKEKNKYRTLTHIYSILTHIHSIYIYMECRKMVLMSLFAGQQWRHRQREQTVDTMVVGGKERVDKWRE